MAQLDAREHGTGDELCGDHVKADSIKNKRLLCGVEQYSTAINKVYRLGSLVSAEASSCYGSPGCS